MSFLFVHICKLFSLLFNVCYNCGLNFVISSHSGGDGSSSSSSSSIQIVTAVKVVSENYFPNVDKMLPQGQRLRGNNFHY